MRSLLMGGQACALYGEAKLSRDTAITVVADAANLARLQAADEQIRTRLLSAKREETATRQCGYPYEDNHR